MNFSNINKIFILNNNEKETTKKTIKFTFYFISLIPPFILNNIRFSFNSFIKEKKLLIKQSYILLT